MKVIAPERVIAIDLHPLSFGYATFEGPDELLDWGIKSFRHGVNAVKVPLNVKLALLLDHCGPDVVVIKEPRTVTLKKMVRAITNLAQCRRIPVRRISGASVQRAFPDESRNKYQIATVVAKRYPELSPRLEPRRKLWQAEKYSMGIFDAAAIGIAYFMHEATSDNGNGNDRTYSPLPH
jgi:hypothetical protein